MPDGTSVKFVENLEKDLAALDGVDAKIASGGGRMGVTMDRYEVSALPTEHSMPATPPFQQQPMVACPSCHVGCEGASVSLQITA